MSHPSRHNLLYIALAACAAASLACTCGLFDRIPGIGEVVGGEGESALDALDEEVLPELVGTLEEEFATEGDREPTEEPPEPEGEPDTPPGEVAPGLPTQVDEGRLDLQGVVATAEDTLGRVLLVRVTNPSSGEEIATIPCGLVFQPSEEDSQRLMVIQEDSVSLPAGGEGELTPFVICIDSSKAAPVEGGTYSLGSLVSGDLLRFAECLCEQDLDSEDFMELFGLQMAIWMVSDSSTFDSMMEGSEGAEGALGDLLGEEGAEILEGMMDMMMGPASSWLELCDIEIEA